MFQPLVQVDGVPMEQSSSSEWSDSESMDSPSASDTDLNSEPEQNVTSRTNDSADAIGESTNQGYSALK